MSDTFLIKFTSGTTSFEVQGTNQEWVDAKLNELKVTAEMVPIPQASPKKRKASNGTARSSARPSGVATKSEKPVGQLKAKWDDSLAQKITKFVGERQKAFDSSAPKQAAILAVFLEDTLGIKTVTPADLELIYRKLGWKTINHLTQLHNAYGRDKFFTLDAGKYELTHAGRVFGRDTSKDKS